MKHSVSVELIPLDGDNLQSKEALKKIFEREQNSADLLQNLGGVSGVAERLHTNLMTGATSESVSARREAFGRNSLPEEAPLTF